METKPANPQILRFPDVMKRTGLKRATLYDKLNENSPRHDPTFPKQVRLSSSAGGRGAVGFVEEELNAWLDARISAGRRPI